MGLPDEWRSSVFLLEGGKSRQGGDERLVRGPARGQGGCLLSHDSETQKTPIHFLEKSCGISSSPRTALPRVVRYVGRCRHDRWKCRGGAGERSPAARSAALGAMARRGGWRLAMALALGSISGTASDADEVAEHLELPRPPHLQKWQLFCVSRRRDLGGNKLLLPREGAFSLFPLEALARKEEGQGRRKEHEGRHRLLSMAVSRPGRKRALGAEGNGSSRISSSRWGCASHLPSSSFHQLRARLRLQA